MTIIAYGWASVLIEFGKKTPDGALPIIAGNDEEVKDTIIAIARHSRTSDELLVPGVPEAANQNEAMDAFIKFTNWAKERYSNSMKGKTHD